MSRCSRACRSRRATVRAALPWMPLRTAPWPPGSNSLQENRSLQELDPLFLGRPFRAEIVLRLGGVLVADCHTTHQDLLLGHAEHRADLVVIRREGRLRASVQSPAPGCD